VGHSWRRGGALLRCREAGTRRGIDPENGGAAASTAGVFVRSRSRTPFGIGLMGLFCIARSLATITYAYNQCYMEYKTIISDEKPNTIAPEFTIYKVDGEDYIFCPIRLRAYKVTSAPEEIVRQWWLYRLKEVYGYDFAMMGVEVKVTVGSTEAKKKADIVVYQDVKWTVPRIFVEVKKPKRRDGLEQLKVYMNATGCRLGMWSNGTPPHVYLMRLEPKDDQEQVNWRELRNIPARNETLSDVDTPITRCELEPITDFLSILRECEDYIKAHEGSSPFDEIFKLVFTKLYDERAHLKNDTSQAHFRVGVFQAPEEARAKIGKLFEKAKARWSGVFKAGEEIGLTDESLAFCVSALQKAYLLKSDADVLGSAFEVMINPGMKGDKGQYFTPRHVIQMCIDVLDPRDGESFFDPACGSGGFLIGGMEHVFAKIEAERDDPNEIIENKKDYASENVFGIDYDHLIAKVAKAYMLIWGDGRSNIAVCDALNQDSWSSDTLAKFTVGEGSVRQLRRFDIIATNPPFAGDIAADDTLSKYELAYKPEKQGGRKRVNKLGKEKLFVERCLRMLKPLGRMAIVLPRGILKNYNDEYVRRFILREARILGVVALGSDMFKPFTNTKTCVVFLQKRVAPLDDLNKFFDDPKPAFAVTKRPGKDKSGRLVRDGSGKVRSDIPEITGFLRASVTFDKP
jgi:type I restriction enzyme M protein